MPSPPGPTPPGPRPVSPEPRPCSRGPPPAANQASDPPGDRRPPQEIIDAFWKDFSVEKPSKATTVIPHNEYAEKAAKSAPRAPERTTRSSYAEAAAICRTKVRKIADECRAINRKYRDPHFDLEADLKLNQRDCLESLSNWRAGVGDDDEPDAPPLKPMGVKRVTDIFDEPKFFIDGPSTNDVRQGKGGDCWLLAALCTLSNKEGLIDRICVERDEQVGVYGFVFHRDGEWFSEIVDDKLYLKRPDYDESFIERVIWEDRDRVDSEEAYRRIYQSNSGALYFSQCEDPNETWLPLLEKCYAKAHGDYSAIDGGFTGEGIEDLTGGVTTEIYTSDILDREAFWRDELMHVNKEFLFGCSTGIWGRGRNDQKGILSLHAYSVMRAVEMDGKRLVLLKNPWGKGEWKGPWSDGSKEWTSEWLQKLDHRFGDDGSFWISYQDLLRKYQSFDRTRLFEDDWRVASMWTTLAIPWKYDYHDTHFGFTLAAAGEVVIVLSQLDDRYFRGLEGQYMFSLAFRLHRAGQEDYIVRTPPSYRMKRSVNVEVKLEAGDYTVMVKVDAERDNKLLPAEAVIRENAKERREKLLRIGLAYDLAHSKGRYVESPEEEAAREAHERRTERRKREEAKEALANRKFFNRYMNFKKEERYQRDLVRARKVQEYVAGQAWSKTRRGHDREERECNREGQTRGSMGRGEPHRPIGAHGSPSRFLRDGAAVPKVSRAGPERTGKSRSRGSSSGGRGQDPLGDHHGEPTKPDRPPPSHHGDAKPPSDTGTPLDPGQHQPQSTNPPLPSADVPELSKPPARTENPDDGGAAPGPAMSKPGKSDHQGEPAPPGDRTPRQLRRESETGSFRTARADPLPVVEEPQNDCESESGSDSDSGSVSSGLTLSTVSEPSEREVDFEIEDREMMAAQGPPPGPPPGPPRPMGSGPAPNLPGPATEGNPWNAVVVAGLRIYHKIPEGSADEEVVKLRVVRPIAYSSDEDSGSEGEEKGRKEGKAPRKLVSEASRGLDVDDSAKDATLEGTENERKMSIDPKQVGKQAGKGDNRGRRRSRLVCGEGKPE